VPTTNAGQSDEDEEKREGQMKSGNL